MARDTAHRINQRLAKDPAGSERSNLHQIVSAQKETA
jgi:hypothetical protein